MTLPNYIINLDELKQILQGALAGADKITSKIQRSKGVVLNSLPMQKQEVAWTPLEHIGIIGVRFGQEDIRNLGYDDYFNMYVDGEEVMSTIYLKEIGEYKPFRDFYLVAKETDITFEYYNNTGIQKEVKFDIDYVEATMPQKEVIILCRDNETGELIETFTMFYVPVFEGYINPPNIAGYSPVSPPIMVSLKPYSPSPQTITFYYEELPPPVLPPDPEIDHLYDWKFVLRWEGNVNTDLDFYAKHDNGEVYYGEKIYEVDENNSIWLDRDFTNHGSSSDREDKPEVITILGKPSKTVKIFAHNYKGGDELSKEVTVEVFRIQSDNTELLVEKVEKRASLFHSNKANVDFLTINLDTDEITIH